MVGYIHLTHDRDKTLCGGMSWAGIYLTHDRDKTLCGGMSWAGIYLTHDRDKRHKEGVCHGLVYTSPIIETEDTRRGCVMGWYTPHPL